MALTPARTRKTVGPKPEIFNQIGQRLRDVYNDVLTQAVPDRFLDLLQQLEAGAQVTTESSPEAAETGTSPSTPDGRAFAGRKKGQK